MKPQFSPESTAKLQQAYELLDSVYRAEINSEPGVHMNYLSDAAGKTYFVMTSTAKTLDPDTVRIIQAEGAVR